MERSEWLEGLKVGDAVLIQTDTLGNVYHRGAVVRITKTLIVVETGPRTVEQKFRRRDGYEPGEGWRKSRIMPFDARKLAEQEAENKRKNLVRTIRGFPFERLSLESLERIYALIKAEEGADHE